jgi:hypothetical protein
MKPLKKITVHRFRNMGEMIKKEKTIVESESPKRVYSARY